MFQIPARVQKRKRYTKKATADGADLDDDADDYDDPREAYGNQSLPVAELPFDFDGIPLDGEQYLATVRLEAASQPSIFYASHNPYAHPDPVVGTSESSQGPSTPEKARQEKLALSQRLSMPSEEWREVFINKFRNMRESLSNAPMEKVAYVQDRLPRPGNAAGWYAWIHGSPLPDEGSSTTAASAQVAANGKATKEEDDMDLEESDDVKEGSQAKPSAKEPSGGALRRLTTEHVLGILDAFPYWLAHGAHLAAPCAPPLVSDAKVNEGDRHVVSVIHPFHTRWLFALLAWLDSRLVSEQISILRTLARACIAAISISRIRSKALGSRRKKTAAGEAVGSVSVSGDAHPEASDGGGGTPAPSDNKADRFNSGEIGAWMVITAIAGIWGQSDLWDDAIADLKKSA